MKNVNVSNKIDLYHFFILIAFFFFCLGEVMALYEHEDCNGQLTMIDNNPHDAQCGRCWKNFCTLCNQNTHFPATCPQMTNWKDRRNLGGAQHFQAYTGCIAAWTRLDGKSRDVTEKIALFHCNAGNDTGIGGVEYRVLIDYVDDELKQLIHLLRWTWVVFWHQPDHYLFYNNTFVSSLEMAFDDLLAAVASYPHPNFHYWIDGSRTRASTAANNLLGVLVVIRGGRFDQSFFREMERWTARPLRGCPVDPPPSPIDSPPRDDSPPPSSCIIA